MTRNKKYLKGRFELSYNKAYQNGINGLVVHKTDRARVAGNVLWDNGKVSKNPPESRQPYAGLVLNAAQDVEVVDNFVKTESKDDYAYVSTSQSILNSSSGSNKLCKVAPAAGTGFGMLSSDFEDIVSTASWKECRNAKKSN